MVATGRGLAARSLRPGGACRVAHSDEPVCLRCLRARGPRDGPARPGGAAPARRVLRAAPRAASGDARTPARVGRTERLALPGPPARAAPRDAVDGRRIGRAGRPAGLLAGRRYQCRALGQAAVAGAASRAGLRPPVARARGTPPASQAATPRRQVCACFDVADTQILEACPPDAATVEARLHAVQARLRCGTQCGSCLPEVRKLLQAPTALAAPA